MSGFTKKAIIACFGEMLKTTPFDKITVSALVAKCEISSNTFYYHFKDIYDLLETWMRYTLSPFVQDMSLQWKEQVKKLLFYMKDNPKTVYHIMNSMSRESLEKHVFLQSDDVFDRMITERIGDLHVSDEDRKYIAEFLRYAFMGFFLRFIWGHMQGDIDKDVDRLARMFEALVDSLITEAQE